MDKRKYIDLPNTFTKTSTEIIAQILGSFFQDKISPVLIAVGGPGGCGKSTFCLALQNQLDDSSILSLDNYKKPRKERQERTLYGSHPDANRIDSLISHLDKLKNGFSIEQPLYDSITGEADMSVTFTPKKFVLLDGEISTYQQFRSLVDFSIFIDSDLKTQLATRMNRDKLQRGYSHEKVLSVFQQSNIEDFTRFGAEGKYRADVRLFCDGDYSLKIEAVSEDVFAKCEDLEPFLF